MSGDVIDFGMGDGDDGIGKRARRFDPKADTTYRMSFPWFRTKLADGTPDLTSAIAFKAVDRIYIEGVGYVRARSPAFNEFGKPRQSVATIIALWPTDSKGELIKADLAKVGVMPWIFDPDKYKDLKAKGDRFPLAEYDISAACADGKYKKLTFTPERNSVFRALLASDKAESVALAKQILADVDAVAVDLIAEMAQDLTLDQIREKLGGRSVTPTGSRAAPDVDNLLDGI